MTRRVRSRPALRLLAPTPSPPPPRYTQQGPRETWTAPLSAVPELQMLGRDEFRIAKDLGKHIHPEAMELCYIERGTVRWWAGREVYDVNGGEVYLTWPDEPHGGSDDALHPCKLYWLHLWFPAAPPAGWLGLPVAEAVALHGALKGLSSRHFPGPAAIARQADRLFELLAPIAPGHSGVGVAADPTPLMALAVRATFLAFLNEILQAGQAAGRRVLSAEVTRAIELMDAHLERPLKLPLIAEQVGLSTSHFKARFRQETGLTPGEFSLRRRVAAAREKILTTDRPLLEIALDLGFSSSQYLATCFKRITGRSPSELRRRM
ncbi:MAG: helix-turn-helix domain-containing protein [Planctomycetota bacterium]